MSAVLDMQTTATEWPCGCIDGERLCADALHLWRETHAALKQSAHADDTAYRAACRAFDRHYQVQEPFADSE